MHADFDAWFPERGAPLESSHPPTCPRCIAVIRRLARSKDPEQRASAEWLLRTLADEYANASTTDRSMMRWSDSDWAQLMEWRSQ